VSKPVTWITLGIDVSKDLLEVYNWQSESGSQITNQAEAISAWLKTFEGNLRIAVEPTSHYHLELIQLAHARGVMIYVVNARQLNHYREAVDVRHKNDPDDARLLARYLEHESESLRPHTPLCQAMQDIWRLIKQRAGVVETRKALTQRLAKTTIASKTLFNEFKRMLERFDRAIEQKIKQLGWQDDYQRCQSIPGIGPLNAAALVATYHRGVFAKVDQFIAFIGLDVRIRDSGQFKNRRKLTKRGESEIRRLLYCAGQPAIQFAAFKDFHQQQLDKGLSKTAARVILGRKLARIAFALIVSQQSFEPARYA
jgi:transposase